MDGAEELGTELPDDLYERVTALSEEGNALCEADEYGAAIARYSSAYDLLPEPKDRWAAATWLLAGIGDCYFQQGLYREALNHFAAAQRCAGGTEEAFVWYRLGQCLYELGEPEERTLDALLSAYMLAGREIFEAEGETKYLDYLRRNADLGE